MDEIVDKKVLTILTLSGLHSKGQSRRPTSEFIVAASQDENVPFYARYNMTWTPFLVLCRSCSLVRHLTLHVYVN